MIPICHSAVRGPVVLLLAILCLALFSAPETKAAQGTKLNSYLSSKVEKVLQSSNSIEEARSGLEKEFRTTRAQHGSLAPLCDYLRDRTENAMAKPLLAVTLAADKQYEAAIDLLTEMAADPGTNAWALAELASVTKMMDIQQTWDLLGGLGQPVVLSTDEKQRINEILELSPSEARIAIKEACRDLVATYGDLAPLIDYLESLDEGPLRDKTLATVLIANGNIHDAVKILAYQAASPAVDPWTLVELGRATEMLGQPTEALTHFERALQASDEPDVHFALTIRIAQLYYESDQPDEAGQALSELLQSEPNIPTESRNFCARIAGLHGDHEFVAEHFQATGEGKELRLNHLYLGETMLQLGRWAEARKQFESALPLAKLARDRRYVIDRIISAARPMNALPQLIDEWLGSEALTAEQLDIVFGLLAGEMGRLDSVFSLFEREDLPPQAREFLESPEFQERLAAFAIEADNFEQAAQTYRDLITRYPDEPSYRDGYVRLLLLEGDRTAARNVYREAMVGTSEPGELMRIAAGARRVGLKAEAIDAAARAGEFRKKSPLEAGLFMASLHSELSENDKALEILRQLEHDIEQNPGDSDADDLMALSDAFERLGYQLDAVRMCRKAVEMEDSERYLRKLISMVERQGKDEEAFILWRKLWDSAEEPMTIIQAKDRLLELGSRNGKLADIALELEDRIGRGELREREVTLLLDIYTSVGDPVSAADVIMELSDAQGGESIATYERLLQVYIESELFGRCKRILRKLIEIDPENRDEHLQLLAIIALERNNKGDAMVVLEELAGRSEDGIFSDSFSASVLKMLGKPAEAALAYRRGLAVNPDDVESWLLWGNALADRDEEERAKIKASGQPAPTSKKLAGKKQTLGLFSVMLEEAEETDLFVICIDGLLNADAPPGTILNALRRLNERIAADPHNLLLYQIAADLNDEAKRPLQAAKVLESSLTVAGDSRTIIMRELIAMAKASNAEEKAIRFGRSILNFTEHLPPAESLSLGNMLLKQGHVTEAEAAFQRILSDPNAAEAARGVIMAYEQAGLPNKAGKVIRALLVENPFDTELILRLALLEEKRGNYRSATKASEKALELLLNQVPRRTDANSARLAQRNRNVNQVDQFSDLAVRNLISSTRTPQDYWRLLGSLQERIQTEIENLKNNDDLGAAIVENPRLGKLADIIRRIGLLFNQPAEIDALDAGLFRLYPNDSSLRISAASARQRWQTALDAASFMTRHDMELTEDKRILTAFAEGRVAVETMLQESTLSSSGRAAVIVLLTIFGYDELADQVLEDFNLKQTPRKDASLLVAAALATGRHQMARDVILSHLSRLDRELESQTGFQRSRVLLQAASLYKMLVAAWPHLSPEERSSAVTIYGTCIGNTDKASELGASYHFLLASIGRADEIKTDTLREYLKRNTSYLHGHLARIFDSWLAGHPPAERTDAVSKLLESKTGDSRAQTLSLLGAYLSSGALTQELLHEFPELAAPKPEWLTSSGADMNRERERFAKKISVALESGENDVRKIITLYNQVLRPAANMLPPEQLDLLIKDYAGTEDAEKLLIQFLLLRQAGREREALPLLNEFSKLPHEDLKSQMVGAILQGQLSACGWNIQALRLAPQNRSTSKRNLKFDYALQDPLAILDPSTENLLDTSVRRMHASKLMPSAEQFKKAVQIYQADTRLIELANTRRAGRAKKWPSRIPATPGGLLGTQQQRSDSILSDVTLLKDGQNILRHELLTMTTSWVSHEANVCREIAVDASRSGLSAELKRSLSEAAKGSALNLFDLELIDALAQEAPAELPDAVASQMEKVTLRDWKGNHRYDENIIQTLKREEVYQDDAERFAGFAAAFRALGREELATPIYRWAVVTGIMENGSSRYLSAYLNGLPGEQRRQALEGLIPFMGVSPIRPVTGEGLGDMLEVLLEEKMNGAANSIVDRYLQERLTEESRANLLRSTTYLAMIGGIHADQQVQDDAVAVTLARLDRTEDYKRLLWKKNADIGLPLSPFQRSVRIASPPPVNNTAALPEPGQVEDVARFIDIHLEMGQQLRREGLLSAENQLAQICMLGQWCINRGLDTRAAALLDQAERLGTQMYLGRLWVADLQRLLGRETDAQQIELELLDHGLLPMERVPGTLDILEEKDGRMTADAAAYKLSAYSNNFEVLTRAARYAAAQELGEEYIDLTQRMRKVGTLFLPANAPCPFKGYNTISDWNAAVADTIARLAERSKP